MLEPRIARLETRMKAMELHEKHRALLENLESGFKDFGCEHCNTQDNFFALSNVLARYPHLERQLRDMPLIRRAMRDLEEIIGCQ